MGLGMGRSPTFGRGGSGVDLPQLLRKESTFGVHLYPKPQKKITKTFFSLCTSHPRGSTTVSLLSRRPFVNQSTLRLFSSRPFLIEPLQGKTFVLDFSTFSGSPVSGTDRVHVRKYHSFFQMNIGKVEPKGHLLTRSCTHLF